MAETIKNQDALHVQKPLPGQSSVLAVDPGTTVYLDFPLDQVEAFFQPDGDLIFRFENGEQVELQNFEDVLSSTDLVLLDGKEVSGDQIMETLRADAGEPASGEAPPSGGAGEYDDYLGDSPDGIDRLGTLGPRDFGFTPEEPNIEGTDFEVSSEGPQAFDDMQDFLVPFTDHESGDIRFYNIETQGNVLTNDLPAGEVSVTGFQVDGQTYGEAQLGDWITLDSGAQFRLSENGTYEYTIDNTGILDGYSIAIGPNPPDSSGIVAILPGTGPDYEFARISFDPASLVDFWNDELLVSVTDQNDDLSAANVPGLNLFLDDGQLDIFDADGIKSIEITGQSGTVVFNSLEYVDTDADSSMSQEIINYTIADAGGATSSANLIVSFGDAPAPEPVPMNNGGSYSATMVMASFPVNEFTYNDTVGVA